MKFTLIAEEDFSGKKLTYEFEEEYLNDVLGEFEYFLKGAGYNYNGQLQIVDDIKTEVKSIWDTYPYKDDISLDLSNIKFDYNVSPLATETFSALTEDHMNFLNMYPNAMSVDLTGVDMKTTCGNCDCGTGCGSKNAN